MNNFAQEMKARIEAYALLVSGDSYFVAFAKSCSLPSRQTIA
jgi:hypothetical protein